MTALQRLQAIENVRERLDALESFRTAGDDPYYQRYRANIAANIVDAVVALTADRSPDELDRIARSMTSNRKRWRTIRDLESAQ